MPTDVVLRSTDGLVFGAHAKNLETFSDGFPIADHTAHPIEETVQLSETSEVLSLLLKFMHHKKQPDCDKLDFKVLSGLAEAVEKYGVYSAMEYCAILMRCACGSPVFLALSEVYHS